MKTFRLLSLLAVLLFSANAMGQIRVEQSQTRLIEPKQDVFIKPLVAEIHIMNNEVKQDFGPYFFPLSDYNLSSFDQLSYEVIEEMKKNGLYKAATTEAQENINGQTMNADIIVAATYHVETVTKDKEKGVLISISGFPGRYVNFKSAGDTDYEWITTVYPYNDRINATGKTKALESK